MLTATDCTYLAALKNELLAVGHLFKPFIRKWHPTVLPAVIAIFFSITSCHQEDPQTNLLTHYKNDSLKTEAAKFLLTHMPPHYAVTFHYEDRKGIDYTKFVSAYKGALMRDQVKDSLGVHLSEQKSYDTTTITHEQLIKNIDEAFDTYYNPISRNTHYSFDIFLNYILPYRVGLEEINDWRSYNYARYQHYLHTFQVHRMSVQDLYNAIIHEQQGASLYAYSRRPHISSPAFHQTMQQVLDIRVPFSCEDLTIRALYALRAIGIPAAYEKIPLWGKFNFGHAQESILFENGKFYPALYGDTIQFKYQIAKMYRSTFETQLNPYDEIRKRGEPIENIPEYFNYTNLIDITEERTDVSDIPVRSVTVPHCKVMYLCVFNGGKWKPVEWAAYDELNKSVLFRNMGRKILYQLMYFQNGKPHLVGAPFVLDTLGETVSLSGSETKETVTATKSDRNKYIVTGQLYELFYWNATRSTWIKLQSQRATTASVQFENVPKRALYKIEPTEADHAEPVRPFTMQDNQQIWW